jgi:hypothetical protein
MPVLGPKRFCVGAGVLALGCFPTTDGDLVPLDRMSFPVAVTLSSGGDRLYVANSDSELQYNTGSLLVLDAKRIRALLPQSCWTDADCSGALHCDDAEGEGTFLCVDKRGSACGELGASTPTQRAQTPGPCGYADLGKYELVRAAARLPPFVTDMAYSRWVNSDGEQRARLYMPVRGDATLHWADVEDDANGTGPVLDCGQKSDPRGACDADHGRGNEDHERTPQGDALPTEPSGIAVSPDGRLILMGHQTVGQASIFVNDAKGPELSYVLDDLAFNPIGVAAIPPPRYASVADLDYAPGFLLTYRRGSQETPRIDLLRYVESEGIDPYLKLAATTTVTTNQTGTDCRGVAVDATTRQACEASCETAGPCTAADTACVDCLKDCALEPLDVYVANRTPSTLLVGVTRPGLTATGSDDVPDLSDAEALRGSPSRVVAGSVIGMDGRPERRVFVLTFESRFLYIYNPLTASVEVRVQTGRGPQGFVVDAARGLGYLAHYSDSYVGVVDLDRRHATYGQLLLNVGQPVSPQSSQ